VTRPPAPDLAPALAVRRDGSVAAPRVDAPGAPGLLPVRRVAVPGPPGSLSLPQAARPYAPGSIDVPRVAAPTGRPSRAVARVAAPRPRGSIALPRHDVRPLDLRVRRLRHTLPGRGSLAVHHDPALTVGGNELGRITVDPGVVTTVASQAARGTRDAGAAARRVLGRSVSAPGLRSDDLGAAPAVSSTVDGDTARVKVDASVRWPVPIGQATDEVRGLVTTALQEQLGLRVVQVDVHVTSLVLERRPSLPRVR